jgi:hypothetical protein
MLRIVRIIRNNFLRESRVSRKVHARFGTGEKVEITPKPYLSSSPVKFLLNKIPNSVMAIVSANITGIAINRIKFHG